MSLFESPLKSPLRSPITNPLLVQTRAQNIFAGAAAAYSVRIPLYSTYSGPLMRVRRSSDNAEQDFSAAVIADANGNRTLDTASLLTFCGAGDGFVTTWYDQSGNGLHAVQTTAANQPVIVVSGVLQTKNGLPAVTQQVNNNLLTIPSFASLSLTSASVSAVYCQLTTNNGMCPWFFSGFPIDHLPYIDGNAYVSTFSSTRPSFGAWTSPANQLISAFTVNTGTTLAIFRNQTQIGSTQTGFTFLSNPISRRVFNAEPTSGLGAVPELIVFNRNLNTTERLFVSNNQISFYGII